MRMKLKPMLPTLAFGPPGRGKWMYEIKYDGYRAMLEWHGDKVHLWSRNGKDLLPQFPEIRDFLYAKTDAFSGSFPIMLDGELVLLENEYKANFQKLQQRGRMGSKERISREADVWPCRYLAFDILFLSGKKVTDQPYAERKSIVRELFEKAGLPLSPTPASPQLCQYIPFFASFDDAMQTAAEFGSEGVVAKDIQSCWEEGKRADTWLKIKNWKTASCFITAMDEQNNYFFVGVYKGEEIFPLGQFLFHLDADTKSALIETIRQHYVSRQGAKLFVKPGICLDLYYLEWADGLREPHFKSLRFDLHPKDCTYEQFLFDEASFPQEITITHPEKLLWKKGAVTKLDYVRYIRKVAHLMLPFLKNRALTVIRAPHGMFGEFFYQKHKPDAAPDFIASRMIGDIDYIVCNCLKSLIWLGNQLAIEFHIPFQTIDTKFVSEIVFDLDPPDRSQFHVAVYAATLLKRILDEFNLQSFVKFSGNKGLQVYIPLPDHTFSWEDTRLFTSFIAAFLVQYDPDAFTIERLKKNRGNRLYVDFIQHAEGKTIIAPYSARKNESGLVAAPLHWEELNDSLDPDRFTMKTVLERIKQTENPFARFFACKETQPFEKVLHRLKKG
jgi:bifunctional non-homologous end joining protein LigD